MPARVQGLRFALGTAAQADIDTASTSFATFTKLNTDVPFLNFGTETDKDWIGKGDEFISVNGVYPTAHELANTQIEKYGSAEFVLWSWAYALGDIALATSLYTINPIKPEVSLELPYFTVAAQLGEGGGMAFDEAYLGCAIEDVETTFHYGPDLASLKNVVNYAGSGRHTIPSGVTFPPPVAEKYMTASSMTINVNGTDYVSNAGILMGSIGWKNNLILPLRYYPGSGVQGGAAVGGRIFMGNRVPTLTFTAFLTKTSDEYTKLVNQTTGTAVLTFTFDATHTVTFTYHSVSFEAVTRRVEEGIVAVDVTCAPKADPTLGVLTVTGKCGIVDIGQLTHTIKAAGADKPGDKDTTDTKDADKAAADKPKNGGANGGTKKAA